MVHKAKGASTGSLTLLLLTGLSPRGLETLSKIREIVSLPHLLYWGYLAEMFISLKSYWKGTKYFSTKLFLGFFYFELKSNRNNFSSIPETHVYRKKN